MEYGLNYEVSLEIAFTDGSGTRFHCICFPADSEGAARTEAERRWREVKNKYRDGVGNPSLDRYHPRPDGGKSFERLDWQPLDG